MHGLSFRRSCGDSVQLARRYEMGGTGPHGCLGGANTRLVALGVTRVRFLEAAIHATSDSVKYVDFCTRPCAHACITIFKQGGEKSTSLKRCKVRFLSCVYLLSIRYTPYYTTSLDLVQSS